MSKVSPGAMGRLLEEISWEGNARKYRQGGRGLENVLTAELFLALDFLPRTTFLGEILRSAVGASETVQLLLRDAEKVTFSLLPGDIFLARRPAPEFCVQPDVIIECPSVYCLVEAKRIKRGAFQPEQLAREYLVVLQTAKGTNRTPLLLLLLPEPPPVPVSRNGRLEIHDAIDRCLDRVLSRCTHEFAPRDVLLADVRSVVAYITWPALREAVTTGLADFSCGDASVARAVSRTANAVLSAIAWHSD
jgi:hypothetical protein